jgi:hypothetical protein
MMGKPTRAKEYLAEILNGQPLDVPDAQFTGPF